MNYIEQDVDRALDALARYINEHDHSEQPKDIHVVEAYNLLDAALARTRQPA